MRPRWAEIEKENLWIKTQYYDFDQDKEAVEKYKIDQNLPVFIFLDKDGNEFLRLNGEISKNKLVDVLIANKDK
jgi:thioredoxin-related protein